jgi:hypothetical protein
MKLTRIHALTIVLALAAPLIHAADASEHGAHHPENAPVTSTQKIPSKHVNAVEPSSNQAMKMDAQRNTMREMHDNMMNAKTPEERQALMADHMKVMKDGMSMMDGGMMADPIKGNKFAAPQAMQQQMNMMQTMMQMMMDYMEMQLPAK